MEDTTVTIIGMIIAAIMMFIVPLILMADRADDISQLVVQTTTAEFVDDIIKTGKITRENYSKFSQQIISSQNTYQIDMEIKILDENTAKAGNNNTYYSIFTNQIEEKLRDSGKLILKQGDAISVTVKNSSQTLSQSIKNFYYNGKGTNIQIIAATASGTVAISSGK